jgi:hypothetical protein
MTGVPTFRPSTELSKEHNIGELFLEEALIAKE